MVGDRYPRLSEDIQNVTGVPLHTTPPIVLWTTAVMAEVELPLATNVQGKAVTRIDASGRPINSIVPFPMALPDCACINEVPHSIPGWKVLIATPVVSV